MQAIDNFWFAERLSNKAEAVRELFRLGIATIKAE